jgi:Ca2+-transporting ATPase
MIVILIVAAAISALLGDDLDVAPIGAIVVLNALLGFVQEYRAERAIQLLRELTVPSVRVHRNSLVNEIPSTRLVPSMAGVTHACVPAHFLLVDFARASFLRRLP